MFPPDDVFVWALTLPSLTITSGLILRWLDGSPQHCAKVFADDVWWGIPEMSSSVKVAKNSLWLIVQPLLLNAISIFAIAYIARRLGKVDYGRFVFAFTYVAMFMPFANMGLRAVTVRSVAADREHTDENLGRLAVVRLILALLVTLVAVVVAIVMGYPPETLQVVYIAATTIVLQTVFSTFLDAFQGHEAMSYVGKTQFVSGAVLTVLSVAVLFIGFGLVGLATVYAFGSALGLVLAVFYFYRDIGRPRYGFDLKYIWASLVKGAPFFFPSLIMAVANKIGIVLVSAMADSAAVGSYGAANTLVDRLTIISDGVCTAMYPTLVILHKEAPSDAIALYRRVFLWMFVLGLPIAVGTTVLAEPIIRLVYGTNYASSVPTLRLLIWWLSLTFLTNVQAWTLASAGWERCGARVALLTAPLLVALTAICIPQLKEAGAALALLLSTVFSFVMLTYYSRKHITRSPLTGLQFASTLAAGAFMGGCAYLLRHANVLLTISVCAATYGGSVWVLRIVPHAEVQSLVGIVRAKLRRT